MKYELRINYDSRKSFYGKAKIEEENGRITLISYNTKVAYIENNKAIVKGMYSNTTLRHIKEFLKQNGFKADNWTQISKDYRPTAEQIKAERAEEEKKAETSLKLISTIANLGNIFCDNQKSKNDWKLRILKAGLENKGLMIPENWNILSEEEKEKRLNAVIEINK